MSQWIDVEKVSAFKKGERKIIEEDDLRILVINHEGEYYAIESMCTHALFELDDAELDGCDIVCPLHGAKFCIKSGNVTAPPAYEALVSYPTRIENDVVQVDIA